MSLEKPIATIRKAVQGLAEERAKKELLEKPEQRHYDSVVATFKMWRMLNPESLELSIKVGAKNQELKKEMGSELYNIYNHAWIRANKKGNEQLEEEVKKISKILKLFPNKYKGKLNQINEQYIKEKADRVRYDNSVMRAFDGKEELLNKAIDITTSSMRELMKSERSVTNKYI